MSLPYAVVQFEEDEGIVMSEVPTNWVTDNGTMCWWPPNKNVNTLVAKRVPPNKQLWSKHHIKVEVYCKTLNSARHRAENLDYKSELSSEEMKGRGLRRKKKAKQETDGSETDTSQEDAPIKGSILSRMPDIPSSSDEELQQNDEIAAGPTDTPLIQIYGQEYLPSVTEPQVLPNFVEDGNDPLDEKILDLKNYFDTKFKVMMTSIANIKLTLDDILTNMKTGKNIFSERQMLADELSNGIIKYIPLKTKQNVIECDELLSESKFQIELASYIQKTGGSSFKDMTIRVLKRIFCDDFAKNCSWLGQRSNFKISNLKVISVIKDAVSIQFNVTDKEFENCVAEWFRQAKQRVAREEKKNAGANVL